MRPEEVVPAFLERGEEVVCLELGEGEEGRRYENVDAEEVEAGVV